MLEARALAYRLRAVCSWSDKGLDVRHVQIFIWIVELGHVFQMNQNKMMPLIGFWTEVEISSPKLGLSSLPLNLPSRGLLICR
jgi:hypothetical protein